MVRTDQVIDRLQRQDHGGNEMDSINAINFKVHGRGYSRHLSEAPPGAWRRQTRLSKGRRLGELDIETCQRRKLG